MFVTTGEIVIRKANSIDLTSCAHLISSHVSGNLDDWQSRFEQDLANPRRHFLVATIDDAVVGYGHTLFKSDTSQDETNASPSGYFLSGLLVAPGHRRKGLGKLLTIARIDALRQVANEIYYLAEPDNLATIDLHSRLGFKEIGSVERDGKEFTLFKLELHPNNRQ
jgi:ribosomal protein S18 acetylase RimI-like enzyme